MSLTAFLREAKQLLHEEGPAGTRVIAENFARGLGVRLGMVTDAYEEETVIEEDWDLLVVLDACRADLMRAVEDEYDFIEVNERYSYGSSSQDWIHKTFLQPKVSLTERLAMTLTLFWEPYQNDVISRYFEPRDFSDVAYITWNAQGAMLDPECFYHLDEVWKTAWRQDVGLVEPQVITDRTISFLRDRDPQRTIVHYMQPHEPFRADLNNNLTVWQRLQRGILSYEEMWDQYVDNLRWVLDDVEVLLENVDAERVVITADHGNSLGEWGIYGHRPYLPFTGMRQVPWVETTATDERTRKPEIGWQDDGHGEHDPEEILEQLGYI